MREMVAARREIWRVLVSESDGRLHATQHGTADGKLERDEMRREIV